MCFVTNYARNIFSGFHDIISVWEQKQKKMSEFYDILTFYLRLLPGYLF